MNLYFAGKRKRHNYHHKDRKRSIQYDNKPIELQWTAFREVIQEIGNNLVFAINAVYRSLVG